MIMTHGTDPFGRDEQAAHAAAPWLKRLTESYFRTQVTGAANLPVGPAVLVCNHGGALPWDALVLLQTLRSQGRVVRPLVEDAVATAPFLGTLLTRLGCVRASQDNGARLLSLGELVAVFPEGMQGMAKPFAKRHTLQRFGRGGFVRLAVRARVPLVPVTLVGGEETSPLWGKVEGWFRDNDRWPYLPITTLVPLPARWQVRIGTPIDVASALHNQGTSDASDVSDAAVVAMANHIRDELQRDLKQAVNERAAAYL
jgi:1-acyl-sn-glycerol-3-phosphate acyltransferase